MLIGAVDFTMFSNLDLGWESQDQHKADPVGFIFWHTFQLKGMKFSVVVKQFKLEIVRLLLGEIVKSRQTSAVSLTNAMLLCI